MPIIVLLLMTTRIIIIQYSIITIINSNNTYYYNSHLQDQKNLITKHFDQVGLPLGDVQLLFHSQEHIFPLRDVPIAYTITEFL